MSRGQDWPWKIKGVSQQEFPWGQQRTTWCFKAEAEKLGLCWRPWRGTRVQTGSGRADSGHCRAHRCAGSQVMP